MNRLTRAAVAAAAMLIVPTLVSSLSAQQLFDVPLRVNMGGPEVVDAAGNLWIGDGDGPGDALDIRPDDAGGTNTIPNWCVPTTASIEALGFDAADPVSTCLQSIRWDNGADAFDYVLELPVPNGTYEVKLYFCEACCDARHFKVELQDELVADDVHRAVYANAFHEAGRLSFDGIAVTDELLRIGLLPCPECPGATDINAILSAFEVLTAAECDPPEFPFNFTCVFRAETDRVEGSWNAVDNAEGYRVLKNGEVLIPNLPADITSFIDANPDHDAGVIDYTLQALDGDEVFAECRCTVDPTSCPSGLVCELDRDTGDVTLSWVGPTGIDVASYDIVANGVTIASVEPPELSYVDTPVDRGIRYEVVPLTDPAGACNTLSCTVENTAILLETPFRVNAGGPEIVDSFGRVWLGDQGIGLDPLRIRPEDVGGLNTIEAWCNPQPSTVEAAGLDPSNPNDVNIFRSIRWDVGADGVDFVIEVPVENGLYNITLYFCESCCPQRHFKIALQDEVVVEDVSQSAYANGPNQVGRYLFRDVTVENRLLRISLLPCPECECPECGGGPLDINALLSAFEIVSADDNPCEQEGFRICTSEFQCTLDEKNGVSGTWSLPECFAAEAFRVLKNGELLEELPGTATNFADVLDTRVGVYELITVVPAGEADCASRQCTLLREDLDFEVPLRINMGAAPATDSLGRRWLGDPGAGADSLRIRPNDLGGTNVITDWCSALALVESDSLRSLGLDPLDARDLSIFHSIRFDLGDDDADGLAGETDDVDGGDIDFHLELPLPDGEYSVGMYFVECCCLNRHIKIYIQDELVDEDAHAGDYSPSGRLGRTGLLVFDEILVEDGLLRIHLEPCVFCAGGGDLNPLISALEVLPAGEASPRCPQGLSCVRDLDGIVVGTWAPPENLTLDGYEVFRDGELIDQLSDDAIEFVDEPPCRRASVYELVPISSDPDFSCANVGMSCQIVDLACPFEGEVRINMGGPPLTDSAGRTWLGDAGAGLDPLDLRVDDLGGTNAVLNWVIGNLRPESMADDDLDPGSAADRSLVSTIRWDPADGTDWVMEIPVANDVYSVTLWFTENFHAAPEIRQFGLEVEGEVVSGNFSVLDYSPDNPVIGWAGSITLDDVDVADGSLSISFPECDPVLQCPTAADRNAILSLLHFAPLGGDDRPRLVRGDSNSSGIVDLTDGVVTLNYLFTGGRVPACTDAADTDDNGRLVISDAVITFSYLFTGGPAPVDPAPTATNYQPEDCGPDATDDVLDCATTADKCS